MDGRRDRGFLMKRSKICKTVDDWRPGILYECIGHNGSGNPYRYIYRLTSEEIEEACKTKSVSPNTYNSEYGVYAQFHDTPMTNAPIWANTTMLYAFPLTSVLQAYTYEWEASMECFKCHAPVHDIHYLCMDCRLVK